MNKLLILLGLLFGLTTQANATAISTAAAALSPGSWSSALTTTGFNSGAVLRPPSTGSLLEFTDKACSWNQQNNTILCLGGAHANSDPGNVFSTLFVRYTDSTDTWINTMPNPVPTFDNAFLNQNGNGIGHDYNHDTIDSAGNYYHRQYATGKVMQFSHAAQTWSQCSNITAINSIAQVAGALTYFPDRNSLVYYDGDWGIWELSLASGNCTSASWTQRASTIGGGFSPQITGISPYHNQAQYSSLCQCIFFVGQTSTTMWKMSSTATFTQVANTPLIPGIPQGGAGAVFTVDPVGGHILMWHTSNAATTMYDYDPVGNTWSTISRANSMFPGPEGGVTETVAIPISTYGVIMFVSAGSSSGGQIRLYKHAAGTPDTTAPTAPSGLTATPQSATQINLAWTASTDNIAVTGYNVERCAGAGCSSFLEVATPATNSANDTGLTASTLYRYRVRAHDGSSNLSSYSSIVQATTTTSGGGSDFATRCAAAVATGGRCFNFDTAADFNTGVGGTQGAYGADFGILPPFGTSDYTKAVRDTSVFASGGGSLRFDIVSNSPSDMAGSFFANFSADRLTQFGPGQDFYVQFRQRFSPCLLYTGSDDPSCLASRVNRVFANSGAGGWKQSLIGDGDPADGTCIPGNTTGCQSSCSNLEMGWQNTSQRGFAQLYNNCGIYTPLEEVVDGSDLYLQNGTATRGLLGASCRYHSADQTLGQSGCFRYEPNEWMTFQLHIRVGTLTGTNRLPADSIVEGWIAREGQPSVEIHGWNPITGPGPGWGIFSSAPSAKYGKIWLLPYHTGKDSSESHPTMHTWYDELIISKAKIADPGTGGGITPPGGVAISRRRTM